MFELKHTIKAFFVLLYFHRKPNVPTLLVNLEFRKTDRDIEDDQLYFVELVSLQKKKCIFKNVDFDKNIKWS